MEVALIPGVLALGESIACQIGYAAAEYQTNTSRSSTGRSHPGIYSNPNSEVTPTRTHHHGIYCNTGSQRRLPAVEETCQLSCRSDASTSSTLRNANSLLSSPRSVCESEFESPCPTARLMMPNKACPEVAEVGYDKSHSPSTRDLLAPTQEKLCPPRSNSPFGMPSPKGEHLAKALTISASTKGGGYLLNLSDLSGKHVSSGLSSTSTSCCSDLDISGTTSAISSSESNASNEEVGFPRNETSARMLVGASPIDQTIVVAPAALESKARSFCRQAFAECDLDHLDDELADLTKDLEALRANMATSKRVFTSA